MAAATAACLAELQAAALPLLRIATTIERVDAQAREVHAQRGALAQERDGLNQHRLEVDATAGGPRGGRSGTGCSSHDGGSVR